MTKIFDAIETISAIKAHHPEACPTAVAMMDAAVLHQRISDLESSLTAWRSMATRLGNVIARSSFDLSRDEAAVLAELKELQEKP